jgi:hypothetical protein
LPQLVCWLLFFLNSWGLLNWPLFRSLVVWKMKKHFPLYLLWNQNYIINWQSIWISPYNVFAQDFFIKETFFLLVCYYILEWWRQSEGGNQCMRIWLGVWTWDVKFKNVILITFSIAKSCFVFVSYNTNIVGYYMYFVLQWVGSWWPGFKSLAKGLESEVVIKNLHITTTCCQVAYHNCLLEAKNKTKKHTSTFVKPTLVHINVQVRANRNLCNF